MTEEQFISILPLFRGTVKQARAALAAYPDAEELRLRRGRPPGVVVAGREQTVNASSVSRETLLHVLEKATGASIHAAAPAIRSGISTGPPPPERGNCRSRPTITPPTPACWR